MIPDNAGMMCINFLKAIGVLEIELIGFDGFTGNFMENYASNDLMYGVDKEQLELLNDSICRHMKRIRKEIKITFLTESLYDV